MSRVHVGFLAAFAALVLGSIGASAALAGEVSFLLITELACGSGNFVVFCWENNANPETLLELEGEEEFTILSPSQVTLLSSLEGESVEITCESTYGFHTNNGATELGILILQESPLEEDYSVHASLLFLGCLLIGTLGTKCKIPTEKATAPLTGSPTSEEDLVFHPASGTVFIEIPIQQRSGCPATVLKTAKVTGTQLCTLENIQEDKTVHLLECGKSELKFAENEATFETHVELDPVHLNERWDITIG